MQLNQIFNIDKYSEAVKYADENNYRIVELKPDINGDRQFQIQKIPELTFDEKLDLLRDMREIDCFPIINRGVLWYNLLTDEQRLELDKWYKEWLDITDTYRNVYEQNLEFDIQTIIPSKPSWLIN